MKHMDSDNSHVNPVFIFSCLQNEILNVSDVHNCISQIVNVASKKFNSNEVCVKAVSHYWHRSKIQAKTVDDIKE